MNIDFEFIKKMEGFELTGYVPNPKGSNSGVTVASGFDLGQRSHGELVALLGASLGDKLSGYAGLKKYDAVNYLELHPLKLSEAEANQINEAAHVEALERLASLWNGCDSYCEFSSLSLKKATVVASVAFQYGNLRIRTPNFWRQVTKGDWQGALSNLRNFGDNYSTRRNKEADLLEKDL